MEALILDPFMSWLTRRARRVFFVYGMRRSGNHACIGWLINALEGRAVNVSESTVRNNFNVSDSGKTIFVNDVSGMSSRIYLRSLRQHSTQLRQAEFIVISVEDVDATYADSWRIPDRSEAIQVRRGTLNLMASRYQNLNRRAREGLGANLQSMKSKFFSTLKTNLDAPVGAIWEFERWRGDEVWRKEFLEALGLGHDIEPPVSPPGLGSSFSGTQNRPSMEQLNQRYMTVEPRAAWIKFLQGAASEYTDVFSAEEYQAILALAVD